MKKHKIIKNKKFYFEKINKYINKNIIFLELIIIFLIFNV